MLQSREEAFNLKYKMIDLLPFCMLFVALLENILIILLGNECKGKLMLDINGRLTWRVLSLSALREHILGHLQEPVTLTCCQSLAVELAV